MGYRWGAGWKSEHRVPLHTHVLATLDLVFDLDEQRVERASAFCAIAPDEHHARDGTISHRDAKAATHTVPYGRENECIVSDRRPPPPRQGVFEPVRGVATCTHDNGESQQEDRHSQAVKHCACRDCQRRHRGLHGRRGSCAAGKDATGTPDRGTRPARSGTGRRSGRAIRAASPPRGSAASHSACRPAVPRARRRARARPRRDRARRGTT
jgi:hypothetical protein